MFDIIGKLHVPTGAVLTDEEGMEFPETVAVDGFHVNTLPEWITEECKPFVVSVNTPSRMYAGRTDTICLKFADKAEFKEVTGYE